MQATGEKRRDRDLPAQVERDKKKARVVSPPKSKHIDEVRQIARMATKVKIVWGDDTRAEMEAACVKIGEMVARINHEPLNPRSVTPDFNSVYSTFWWVVSLCISDKLMGVPAAELFDATKKLIPGMWERCTTSAVLIAIRLDTEYFSPANRWGPFLCRILPGPSLVHLVEEAMRGCIRRKLETNLRFLMRDPHVRDSMFGVPALWDIVLEYLPMADDEADFRDCIDFFWEDNRGRAGLCSLQTKVRWLDAMAELEITHPLRVRAVIDAARPLRGCMVALVDEILQCLGNRTSISAVPKTPQPLEAAPPLRDDDDDIGEVDLDWMLAD